MENSGNTGIEICDGRKIYFKGNFSFKVIDFEQEEAIGKCVNLASINSYISFADGYKAPADFREQSF